MFRRNGDFVFIITMAAMLLGVSAAGAQIYAPGVAFCAPDPGINPTVSTTVFTGTGCDYFTFNNSVRQTTLNAGTVFALGSCGTPLTARAAGAATCAAALTFPFVARWIHPGRPVSGNDPSHRAVSVNTSAGQCAVISTFEGNIFQSGSNSCGPFFHKYKPYKQTMQFGVACGFVCVSP
jgi:hypothetical protein